VLIFCAATPHKVAFAGAAWTGRRAVGEAWFDCPFDLRASDQQPKTRSANWMAVERLCSNVAPWSFSQTVATMERRNPERTRCV